MSKFNAEMIYFICDTRKKEGKILCEEILAEAKSIHGKGFGETYITQSDRKITNLIYKLDMNSVGSVPITIETDYVTDNQWNSEEFGRVMDFIKFVRPHGSKDVVMGYFLDFSLELADLRIKNRCRYCGKTMEDKNDPLWLENWHLACSIEYMTVENLDLSYSPPIWKGGFHKKYLPSRMPQFVFDNFKKRKMEFMVQKAQQMLDDRSESLETYIQKHEKETAIKLWLASLCNDFAEHLNIFIYAKDPIIFTHKNPIEISFNWSSQIVTKDQFNSIISYMKKNYEMDDNNDNNAFYFCSQKVRFVLGR